ncbi:MAG: flagellar hook protein FlgE [Gammaproteobacteria bacterium]|nr:flagellar hook protein FlgE [Gammaproteobacteria bacterium]
MPFRIALSGLHAASTDLSVTGNNIANSATVGFKKSRAEFVDVYAQAYGSITNVTNGSGVRTPNIRQMFAQGNIEYTDNATDLAITGQGFFIVEDDKGRYLSRNGTFGLNRDGFVVNNTGQTLQVFPAVTVGANTTFNTGSLIDLQLKSDIGAPRATTQIDVNLNVDGDLTPLVIPTAGGTVFNTDTVPPFSPADPATYHHVTASTVYDSLGAPHVVTMYYRKVDDSPTVASNTWQVFTEVDGLPTSPFDTVGAVAAGAGTPAVMRFNTDGTLANVTVGATSTTTLTLDTINTTTGSAPLNLTFDYGPTTQYGSEFAVNDLSQDGFTTGRLTGFDVEENGIVYARYTNGNAEILGMVGLATVANPQGLRQKGDSLWVETFDAGDVVLGQPGTASLGLIQAGALEASTVEIADELVNMIVAQRNYQANAQVISTADQLTQTLLQIR